MVDSHHSAADDFGERLERHYERVVGQATFRTDAVAAEDTLDDEIRECLNCLTLIDRVCRQQKLREALQARSVPSSDRHSSLPKRLAHFEIERELGRGGAGIVVLATDTRLRRKVALKVPHPQFLVTDDLRRRFVREAEATARLNHPHIVRVYEAGNDGPLTYLASEYCEGKTLADWLATQTEPVSPKLAVSIVRDLAEAVQHAHTKAVIHRDIKPSNVLVAGLITKEGSTFPHAKLCDFGLAKVLDEGADQTHTGDLLGTPAYMAPEQAQGSTKDVDVRTDVYALGVLLFELLTKTTPFTGESRAAILLKVINKDPASVRTIRKDVPLDLTVITAKCLSKTKEERYSSAKELVDDLTRFLLGQPIAARPNPWWERLQKWVRRHPAKATAAALGILLPVSILALTLVGAIIIFRQNREILHRLYVADMGSAKQAIDDHRFDEARAILGKYRPSFGQPDVRSAAWQYLASKVPNENTSQWKLHNADIYSIAVSPDETLLATASRDGTACVWKLGATTLLHRLVGHEGDVNEVRFSPDGSLIATCGDDGTIRLWDTATGTQRHAIEAHKREIGCIAFRADGRAIFSGGKDNAVRLWDVQTGQLKETVWEGGENIYALAMGANGSLMIASKTVPVLCIDVSSKTVKWSLTPSEDDRQSVYSMCYSPTADQLVVGAWNAHRILNAATGEVIGGNVRNLGGGPSSAVAISPNGVDVVFANGSGVLETRPLGSDTSPRSLYSSRARIWGITFLGSDEVLFSTAEGIVKRVSLGQQADSTMQTITRLDDAVDDIIVNDSGDTLYAIGGKSLVAIDPKRMQIKRLKQDFGDKLWGLDYREEEDLLVTGHEFGRVHFWKASTFEWVAEAPTIVPSQHERAEYIDCVAFVPEKSCVFYATDSNRRLRMYDYRSQSTVWEMEQPHGIVLDIAFMPNGNIVTACANGLDVYEAANNGYTRNGRPEHVGLPTGAVHTLPRDTHTRFLIGRQNWLTLHHGHNGNEVPGGVPFSRSWIKAVAVDRAGKRIVACGSEGEICQIRDEQGLYVERGSLLEGIDATAAAYSADGSMFFCGLADGRLMAIKPESTSRTEFHDPSGDFRYADVSPRLDLIGVKALHEGAESIRLFETDPLCCSTSLSMNSFAVSIDGSRVYGTRSDRLFEITDRRSRVAPAPMRHLPVHCGELSALSGNRLLLLGKDGSVHVIDPHDRSKDAQIWNDPIAKMERAAVSPRGDAIAVAMTDKIIRVWSADTLGIMREVMTNDFTRALSFSPDGSELAVGMINGVVETYELASGKVTARLRQSQNVLIRAMAYLDPTTLLVSPDLGDLQAWDTVAESMLYTIDAGLFGSVNDINIVPAANAFVLVGTDGRGRGLLRIHRLEFASPEDER